MANINNTSSYMDEDKKQIIKESNYTFRDALEVSSYLIETGKFEILLLLYLFLYKLHNIIIYKNT